MKTLIKKQKLSLAERGKLILVTFYKILIEQKFLFPELKFKFIFRMNLNELFRANGSTFILILPKTDFSYYLNKIIGLNANVLFCSKNRMFLLND